MSGNARAHRGHGRDRAADLLGRVDLGARAGLHPADVDDVGARPRPPRRPHAAPHPSAKVAPRSKNESGVRLTIAITISRSSGRTSASQPQREPSGCGSLGPGRISGYPARLACRQRATISSMGYVWCSVSRHRAASSRRWCSACLALLAGRRPRPGAGRARTAGRCRCRQPAADRDRPQGGAVRRRRCGVTGWPRWTGRCGAPRTTSGTRTR